MPKSIEVLKPETELKPRKPGPKPAINHICEHFDRPHYAKLQCRECYMCERRIVWDFRYDADPQKGLARYRRYNQSERGLERKQRYAEKRRQEGKATLQTNQEDETLTSPVEADRIINL